MASKPWKALKLLKGSASQAPKLIRALLDESDVHGIDEFAVGNQKWCSAGPRIVEELLNGVGASASPSLVLMVVADIVGGGATDSWLAEQPSPNKTRQKIAEGIVARGEELLSLSMHEDPTVVSAVCAVLAQVPALSGGQERLLELSKHPSETVQASAAIALTSFASTADTQEAWERLAKSKQPLVKAATALSRLCAANETTTEGIVEVLEAWIDAPLQSASYNLPWFREVKQSTFPYNEAPIMYALHRIIKRSGEPGYGAACEALTQLETDAADHRYRRLSELANRLMRDDFDQRFLNEPSAMPGVPGCTYLPKKLNGLQLILANGLKDSRLCAGGRAGIPPATAARHVWLGDTPGPLGTDVTCKVGKETSVPRWLAMTKEGFKAKTKLLANLSGSDAYRALAEYCCGYYEDSWGIREDIFQRVIDEAGSEAPVIAREVGHEIIEVLKRRAAVGASAWLGGGGMAILFLPFVTSNLSVPEEWYRLTSPHQLRLFPLAAKLWAEQSEALRTQAIIEFVGTHHQGRASGVSVVLRTIDMIVPSDEACGAIRKAVADVLRDDPTNPFVAGDLERAAARFPALAN